MIPTRIGMKLGLKKSNAIYFVSFRFYVIETLFPYVSFQFKKVIFGSFRFGKK